MTLRDVIARLSEFEDGLVIYAERDPEWTESSRAVVAADTPAGSELGRVIDVAHAKEAVRVWSQRRKNVLPSLRERYEAVLFFALHGAHLPCD